MGSKPNLLKQIALILSGLGLTGLYAAAEAATLEYDGPTITFEQIYANPDDNNLKLNYARQQAAAGDLLSAAGALEGMLYSQPNWDSARLFYAIVLYELDDRAAAMREFALLQDRPLTPEDRKLANSYQNGEIEPEDGPIKISGRVELGVRLDDNAGNALENSIGITSNTSDVSAFANGALRAAISLSEASDLKLNVGAIGQTLRHDTFSKADYDVIGGNVGLSMDGADLFWKADIELTDIYLDGEKYLSQTGPTISIGSVISEKTEIALSAARYDQDFKNLSFSSRERRRSGKKHTIRADVSTQLTENMNFGASVGYEDKNAKDKSLAYDGFHVAGHASTSFDAGIYVKGNIRYRHLKYDALDAASPSKKRNDKQIITRVATGASLNSIGSWFGSKSHDSLSHIRIETGINYTNYDSNIAVYEYKNLGADLKFAWDF